MVVANTNYFGIRANMSEWGARTCSRIRIPGLCVRKIHCGYLSVRTNEDSEIHKNFTILADPHSILSVFKLLTSLILTASLDCPKLWGLDNRGKLRGSVRSITQKHLKLNEDRWGLWSCSEALVKLRIFIVLTEKFPQWELRDQVLTALACHDVRQYELEIVNAASIFCSN